MGGAVVKAWEAHTRHDAEVGDSVDAIRGGITDKENIIKHVGKLSRFVTTRLSAEARAAHLRAIIRFKAIATLQSVMDEHPREELLLRPVCQLLTHLAKDEACAEVMRVNEVRAQLLEIVRKNGDDNFVLSDVRLIFVRMKASLIRLASSYFAQALENNDLQPIQLALKNQPRELVVHQGGLETLSRLVRDKEVALRLLDGNGVLKQILLSVARFRADVKVQHYGFLAMTYIAKADIRLATLLGRVGAISVIAHNLRYLDEDAVDRDALQQAIWALNELGKIRKNKARLESERIGLVLRHCTEVHARKEAARAAARELRAAQKEAEELHDEGSVAGEQVAEKREADSEVEAETGPARPIVIPLKLKRLMKASQEADQDPHTIALVATSDSNRPASVQKSAHGASDTDDEEASETQNEDEEEDDEEKFVIREFDNTDSVAELDDLIREVAVTIDGFGPDPNAVMTDAQVNAAYFRAS